MLCTDPVHLRPGRARRPHGTCMFLSRLLATALLVPLAFFPETSSAIDIWSWPLSAPHSVTRSFEAPPTPYKAGHRGVDLSTVSGDPVFAPADGVVSFAGVVVDRPVLSIQHAGDLISSFEPVDAVVAEGEHVSAGQTVGLVSVGGHCGAGCIHFGVRLHGQYVSPMLYLVGIRRAILLPVHD